MGTAPALGRSRAWALGAALALAAALPGCGSSSSGVSTITDTAAVAPLSRNCPDAALEAIEAVAHRVYQESADGRIIGEAVARLSSSTALAQAVQEGDATAARAVLRSLLRNQIVAVRVTRGGRVLAAIERGAGIGPASGRIVNARGEAVGAFTVAVQGANGYAQTVAGLLATRVVMRSGRRVLAATLHPAPALGSALPSVPTSPAGSARRALVYGGTAYRTDTFAGVAFPGRPLTVTLLAPSAAIAALCPSRPAAGGGHGHGGGGEGGGEGAQRAWAAALGQVAERVYYAEHAGSKAELLLRYVERSPAFRRAVLAGDPHATWNAIVGFFRSHLHIVRVRVLRAGKVLADVGGPHVLAPIPGVIRDARGRVAARFLMAIQDDMGFQILARAFTGAQVVMRQGSRQVMGTLSPGSAPLPDRGPVVLRGVSYQAYSFVGEAFPTGPLRISLLYPTG